MNSQLLLTRLISIFIVAYMVSFTLPVYTQEDTQKSENTTISTDISSESVKSDIVTPPFDTTYKEVSFPTWMNVYAYAGTLREEEEKEYLRKEWEEMLGMDIFLPYFKAEEIESWVKEKAKLNFFKMKGEPKFRRNQIQYKFNFKF